MTENELIKIIENYNQSGKEDTYEKCGLFSGAIEEVKEHITKSEEFKKAFDFIKKVQSHKMSLKIPLKDEEKQDLRAFLINSLIKNAYSHFFSVYQLCCYGLCFESKILIRSMIENLVKLKRMVQEKNYYLKYMIYSNEKMKELEGKKDNEDVEKEIDVFLNELNSESNETWTKGKAKEDCKGFMNQIQKIKNHDPKKSSTHSYGEYFIHCYKNLCSLVHADLSIIYRQMNLEKGELKIKEKKIAEPSEIKETFLLSGLFLFYSIEEVMKAFKIQPDQEASKSDVINSLKELLRDLNVGQKRIDEISRNVSELIFF